MALNLNAFEKAALLFVANELTTERAAILTALGPIDAKASTDLVAFAKEIVAKYSGTFAPILDGFITMYGPEIDPELNTLEGDGITALAAALTALANKV